MFSNDIMKSSEVRIAIDGFAATGKSTISKELSNKMNLTYLNTGFLYRLVALYFIKNKIIIDDDQILKNSLKKLKINFKNGKVTSNFDFFEKELFQNNVSLMASKIASKKIVRNFLYNIQKDFSKNKGIILEGRDIGTIIMPDADVKFFLTVSLDEGAKRRFNDLKNEGKNVLFEDVKKDLEKRNFNDLNRKLDPLKKDNDAIEIDTTNLTKSEVVEIIQKKIIEVLKNE